MFTKQRSAAILSQPPPKTRSIARTSAFQPGLASTKWQESRVQAPPWMRRVQDATLSSQESSIGTDNSQLMVNLSNMTMRVQRELSLLKYGAYGSSMDSFLYIYDMNELPYISHMRSLMLIVCCISFFVAPGAYMPLGTIQAIYNQKCFLYAKLVITIGTISVDNDTTTNDAFILDPVHTQWGSTDTCHLVTFAPVSVAIFSVIIGWSTLTIWPAMMSLGKGGVLMLLYTVITILCLVVCIVSNMYLRRGYSRTCADLSENSGKTLHRTLTCRHLNNEDVYVIEVRDSWMVRNINKAMFIAEVVGWCLAGLAVTDVLICMTTFLIIWFHFHLTPSDLLLNSESDDDNYTESNSDDEEL